MDKTLYIIDPESGIKTYVTKEQWDQHQSFMASLTPKGLGRMQVIGISPDMDCQLKKLWISPPSKIETFEDGWPIRYVTKEELWAENGIYPSNPPKLK